MDLGQSQRKLARQLGVDSKTVWHWEKNKSRPLRWMMPVVHQFLGMAEVASSEETLGEKLTAYRRGQRLSQEQLARKLGVHKTTVVRWETGRRPPLRYLQRRIDALISDLRRSPTPRNTG
jgi:transcriptional regulator with XRE-family HTH domain